MSTVVNCYQTRIDTIIIIILSWVMMQSYLPCVFSLGPLSSRLYKMYCDRHYFAVVCVIKTTFFFKKKINKS